ncbi:hypothetical protein AAG906_026130 [Vitis piasezkii]
MSLDERSFTLSISRIEPKGFGCNGVNPEAKPKLKRFLRESNCVLAVSLNATTDEVRNWVMPINRKYNLSLLLQTLREELRSKHNYKVLFEYVMLAGVNDSQQDARRLIDLVQGIPCKVNLISEEKIIEFKYSRGVLFSCDPRGDDQMAAVVNLGSLPSPAPCLGCC